MDDASVVVGLDEAGVGPAYGSVWAAAVHLPAPVQGVADSKRLSERKRAALREVLLKESQYGLGEVTFAEIDAQGLGEARRLVFDRALDDLVRRFPECAPTRLIVDGTIFRPWRGVPHECIEKADALYPCASAASILAKTTRDAQVLAWCDADSSLEERYGLRSNKGYLSARHVEGLRAHGWSDRHRRSYRIRALQTHMGRAE